MPDTAATVRLRVPDLFAACLLSEEHPIAPRLADSYQALRDALRDAPIVGGDGQRRRLVELPTALLADVKDIAADRVGTWHAGGSAMAARAAYAVEREAGRAAVRAAVDEHMTGWRVSGTASAAPGVHAIMLTPPAN